MKSGEQADNRLIGPGSNDYGRKPDPDDYYEVVVNVKTTKKQRKILQKLQEITKPKTTDMKVTNDVPRRIRLYLNVPAELAITNAIQEIEKLGADVRLTEAQILLQKAKDLVSDYIDENLKQVS